MDWLQFCSADLQASSIERTTLQDKGSHTNGVYTRGKFNTHSQHNKRRKQVSQSVFKDYNESQADTTFEPHTATTNLNHLLVGI